MASRLAEGVCGCSAHLAITFLALFIATSVPAGAQIQDEVIDRLIAIVGDEIILESEVYQNAQSIALQQGADILRDPAKFQKLREDVLREMINQKILLAKAREDSIVVEAREVDAELENRLQQIIQNVGSEEKLEELYGYSIRRIRRDFRSVVEEGLLVDRVKYNYLKNIRVTRSEIEQYFRDHPDEFPQMKDAVEIAHILRETGSSERADARALARADSIYEALKRGASFDSLAAILSEDTTTAKNGGHVGWTERGDLLSSYENVAFSLNPGEISRPVKTRYGYHIIRLEERREEKINTSHILIRPKVLAEDEGPVIDLLTSIREQIQAGTPFGDAAKEYSQDLESANRGGYLGWFSLEDMPENFRDAVASLELNEISQPFKTQYGYHIVKLLNRREARPLSLKQDWELISGHVLNAKKERKYNEWLDELKTRYYIEIKG